MMGSSNGDEDERPAHRVTINYSFYMGKYEVTRAQWQAVMVDSRQRSRSYNLDVPSAPKDCSDCPIMLVSWDDVQKFIKKLNGISNGLKYRLPTESEWEYACRAGTTDDEVSDFSEMAWYEKNSGGHIHPVGQRRLNAWGLADMKGNVSEWCEDEYHKGYAGAPIDGSAWSTPKKRGDYSLRILRGGSFKWGLNSANRQSNLNWYHDYDIGFRVVAVR